MAKELAMMRNTIAMVLFAVLALVSPASGYEFPSRTETIARLTSAQAMADRALVDRFCQTTATTLRDNGSFTAYLTPPFFQKLRDSTYQADLERVGWKVIWHEKDSRFLKVEVK